MDIKDVRCSLRSGASGSASPFTFGMSWNRERGGLVKVEISVPVLAEGKSNVVHVMKRLGIQFSIIILYYTIRPAETL